jgi:hypothetical protein
MNEILIAFAILHGGYTDWCTNIANGTCKPPMVVQVVDSPFVHKTRAGWYANGTAYVKERPAEQQHKQILEEITTVHEFTHHLQRLSGRYHNYRGICNQYLAEREAYEVGEAYARSKGYTTNYQPRVQPYKDKCEAAVAAGLVKRPNRM